MVLNIKFTRTQADSPVNCRHALLLISLEFGYLLRVANFQSYFFKEAWQGDREIWSAMLSDYGSYLNVLSQKYAQPEPRTIMIKLSFTAYIRPMQTDAILSANNTQRCWVQHAASVCMEPIENF